MEELRERVRLFQTEVEPVIAQAVEQAYEARSENPLESIANFLTTQLAAFRNGWQVSNWSPW